MLHHNVEHDQDPNGYALASVLLIMVILTVTAVPLLDAVMRNRETVTTQRVITHLNQEARENLEVGIYAVNLADGFPPHYARGGVPATRAAALACTKRLNSADPSLLEGVALDDPGIRQSQSTTLNNRNALTFVVNKPANTENRLDRFVIVSCAMASGGEISVFASEIARVSDGYQTLKSGQF